MRRRKWTRCTPADAALNLPTERYSFGVRRLVAEEACKGSFDEVLKQTKKIIGVAVAKRQIEWHR